MNVLFKTSYQSNSTDPTWSNPCKSRAVESNISIVCKPTWRHLRLRSNTFIASVLLYTRYSTNIFFSCFPCCCEAEIVVQSSCSCHSTSHSSLVVTSSLDNMRRNVFTRGRQSNKPTIQDIASIQICAENVCSKHKYCTTTRTGRNIRTQSSQTFLFNWSGRCNAT